MTAHHATYTRRDPEQTREASGSKRCPVCDGDHKCTLGSNGLIMCGRRTGTMSGFKFMGRTKDDVWGLYRRADDPTLTNRTESRPVFTTTKAVNWDEVHAECRAAFPGMRDALEEELGVPGSALDAVGYGWSDKDKAYTTPERDGKGKIVGINRRMRGGVKMQMFGGERGLTIPEEYPSAAGPLLLVEGASDTAALYAAGIVGIGRPSNTGGVSHLAVLLKEFPADRPIIVVGENDAKPEKGIWPGKDGAVKVAGQLAGLLGRPVTWALVPDEVKDVRAWLARDGATGDELVRRLVPETADAEPSDNPLIAKAMDNAAFHAAEFRREWVIEDALVCQEPGTLAGPSKAMKTGLIVDAAVSVAAARKFLNRFWVPKPRRVYVISAESGPVTLQARMREVCKAKGVDPVGLPIQWYTEVENLATVEGCGNLAEAIQHFGSELVLLDPGYLLLASERTNDSAGNYYAMGGLLSPIGEACRKLGATLVIATHTNGKLQHGTHPELSHISYAGYQQWTRQWWLLNRRTEYEDDGRHELFLRYGGSAGHSGMINLDIDEGILQPDGSGRKWGVSAVDASAARKQEKEAKADAAMEQLHKDSAEVLGAMVALLAEGNEVASRNKLEERTGLSRKKLAEAIKLLLAEGGVVEATGNVKAGRATVTASGIRRPDGWQK